MKLQERLKRLDKRIFLALPFFILLLLFTGYIFEKTSTPDYCNTCHVMNNEYESWFMTGVHRNIRCIDCHLPHSNVPEYIVWKGLDGMKDLAIFHLGIYSEQIGISDHGKNFIKRNCLRCHEGMTSVINTDGRDCWSCHRRIMHRFPPMAVLL